jgi:predicted naringenin-chalcone synthase
VLGSGGAIDLVGNAVFSIGAAVLLVAASRSVRREHSKRSVTSEFGIPITV